MLQAPDVETRNRVIASHLARLESSLARTQDTVASLRGLLDRPRSWAGYLDASFWEGPEERAPPR